MDPPVLEAFVAEAVLETWIECDLSRRLNSRNPKSLLLSAAPKHLLPDKGGLSSREKYLPESGLPKILRTPLGAHDPAGRMGVSLHTQQQMAYFVRHGVA
jgi:hypothetical protein